jgi:hypothetical protein
VVNDKKKQERQCIYKSSIEARSRDHCCRAEAVSITHSQCVSVAVVMKHAKCMHRIILPSVACLFLQYFSTLSKKDTIFGEKNY